MWMQLSIIVLEKFHRLIQSYHREKFYVNVFILFLLQPNQLIMRINSFTSFILIFLASTSNAQNEQFTQRAVNASYTLNAAWEITYGPNDSLWVTENKAYLVSRINVANGSKTVLLNLLGNSGDNTINFSETGGGNKPKRVKPAQYPQGGLMGLALHPALYSSDPAIRRAKPWVYIAYVYHYVISGGCSSSSPCYYYTKIVRYNYGGSTLTNPVVILDSIPGSNDHNSGRLKIGPDNKLYYTVGDMGAGQFNNTNRPNNALNPNSLEGKVLRLNTEPDGGAGKDAWVPNDNPFYSAGAVTPSDYVYTQGITNLTIDTKAWASQTYLVQVKSSDNKILSSTKVVKAK
jgi:glucose/arabinose dehydrogenase